MKLHDPSMTCHRYPSKDDYAFFGQYLPTCKCTDDGILLRNPGQREVFPKMPLLKKQSIDLSQFEYLGFQNTRKNDSRNFANKTVGFFKTDGKFEHVCDRPWKYTEWLRQYKHVLSPDLSCYTDMPIVDQWRSIYWNMLIGAYWQHCGLIVIPTASWTDERSYGFCFSGMESGSVIAVSTMSTRTAPQNFLAGFRELCLRVKPELVICYCNPYPEMYNYAKIIAIEHDGTNARKIARRRPLVGQMVFDNL